jgi:ubiquinone/menaquinone biosynthesis C-methylase UbiE
MSYLMESAAEGRRLLAQEAANPSLERLRLTGLKEGDFAADVGCGAGAVTGLMARLVGERGRVTAIEPNADRLAEARAHVGQLPNVEFLEAGLPGINLSDAQFDYVWCQYVLEYFADPRPALKDLVRLTRRGGRLVVAELDGFGLAYWPVSPEVEAGKETFLRALASTGFDLFIGRKLYSYFREAGLTDVAAHVSPFHVTVGQADERLLADWRQRFEVLRPVMVPAFGTSEAYLRFAQSYLDLLASPDSFKYSVILTVSGRRP